MRVKFVDTERNAFDDCSFTLDIDVSSVGITLSQSGEEFLRELLSPKAWKEETDWEISFQEWVEQVLDEKGIYFVSVRDCDMSIDW